MKNRRCRLCHILQRPLLRRLYNIRAHQLLIINMDAAPNLDIFTGAKTNE